MNFEQEDIEDVKYAMERLFLFVDACQNPSPQESINIEKYADMKLIGITNLVMARKLDKKRLEGRGGWWKKNECSVEVLEAMLKEHVKKGDMVDVMNFAGMIYIRKIMGQENAT